MRTAALTIGSVFLLLLLSGTYCGRDNDEENNVEIFRTWKFIAFGNLDGSKSFIQSDNCDECYTITFYKDTTISGRSIANLIHKKFIISGNQLYFPNGVLSTFMLEEGDPHTFTEDLEDVQSFEIKNFELKLFYSDNKFLLFNPKTR